MLISNIINIEIIAYNRKFAARTLQDKLNFGNEKK